MLSGEATNSNAIVFGLTDRGSNTRSTALEANVLTITPSKRLTHVWPLFCAWHLTRSSAVFYNHHLRGITIWQKVIALLYWYLDSKTIPFKSGCQVPLSGTWTHLPPFSFPLNKSFIIYWVSSCVLCLYDQPKSCDNSTTCLQFSFRYVATIRGKLNDVLIYIYLTENDSFKGHRR